MANMQNMNKATALRLVAYLRQFKSPQQHEAAAALEWLHTEIETLRTGYAAARLEIASLQAQLDAVGAGGVGPLVGNGALANEGTMPAAQAQPVAGQCRFTGDEWWLCSIQHVAWVLSEPSEFQGYEARYLYAAAQAQEDAVAQAVAAEREACAKLCDALEREKWESVRGGQGRVAFCGPVHCAKAIRARGTNAS